MVGGYPCEACHFLNGKRGGLDLGEKGNWEERRGGNSGLKVMYDRGIKTTKIDEVQMANNIRKKCLTSLDVK